MADVSLTSSSQAEVVLGEAGAILKKTGKWEGRSEKDIVKATKQIVAKNKRSCSGIVTTLCISPENGSRLPCDKIEVNRGVVGDCRSSMGWTNVSGGVKNEGTNLLVEDVFVESLLSGVTVVDEEIARETVRGVSMPGSTSEAWAIGDNIYVTGLDMTWENLGIGDILMVSDTGIVNTGFPHFACWKYAVRSGEAPRAYMKGREGTRLRLRGIKGAVILPAGASSTIIRTTDQVRIVREGTSEYASILRTHRPPLKDGEELIFKGMKAAANDTKAYIELLICAGKEAARNDYKRYNRTLPNITRRALGLAEDSTEISEAAMSGDGTVENVGIRIDGEFQCRDCRQKFESERALQLHWKFIHDPSRHQEE